MSEKGTLPRSHRWAGVGGIATVLLFAAGNALWVFDQPSWGASGPELVDFYTDLSGRIVAGALLSLLSIALFIVAASALRAVLIELEGDELLANVAFGGSILAMAAGLGAETINMAAALRAGDGELGGSLAKALFDTSFVLGYNAAGIGIGLLVIAAAVTALRSGALMPSWLAILGLALGGALLTPLSQFVLAPSFFYLLAVSVLILRGSAVRGRGEATVSS